MGWETPTVSIWKRNAIYKFGLSKAMNKCLWFHPKQNKLKLIERGIEECRAVALGWFYMGEYE